MFKFIKESELIYYFVLFNTFRLTKYYNFTFILAFV